MRKQADGLTDRSRMVDGAPTSLLDIGYAELGIDEGWEACGQGFNHTQHTQYGWPVVDTTKFADMNATSSYIHSKGLRAGWYFNGCACGEPVEKLINYEGDVAENAATHFDAAKLDSCGSQKNLSLYYELFNPPGEKAGIIVENCHQGGDPPRSDGFCPYHVFRVSGDIINLFDRVLSNLQHSRAFLGVDATLGKPLSRPGCWAYPERVQIRSGRETRNRRTLHITHTNVPASRFRDPHANTHCAPRSMLEVGRMPGEVAFDGVTQLASPAAESRTHFGAWAITSAPLVLGLSLSLDDPVAQKAVDSVWDLITNREVVAVSQAYAGLPGALVREWQAPSLPTLVVAQCPPPPAPSLPAPAHTYTFLGSALAGGDDIAQGAYDLAGAEAFCSSTANCQGFTYHSTARDPAGANVYFKSALNVNNDATWSASTYCAAMPAHPSTRSPLSLLRNARPGPPYLVQSYARDYSPPLANVSHWSLDAATGLLRQGDGGVCLDAAGQLPQDDAPNWMRMRACDATVASQRFHMLATGQIVSNSTGQCLGNNVHWLWDWRNLFSLTGCDATQNQQLWTLRAADGALQLPAAGVCAGSSDVSGPASQVWRKPLAGGKVAVLVVNGALLPQTVSVSLSELNMTATTASARDAFAKADLPPVSGSFSVTIAPHDSAMVVLTPTST